MKKKYLYILILLFLTLTNSIYTKENDMSKCFEPAIIDIFTDLDNESFKGFRLYREYLIKADKNANQITIKYKNQVGQHNNSKSYQKKQVFKQEANSVLNQKWYRSGYDEIIEVDVKISSNNDNLNRTIIHYTQKLHSIPYTRTKHAIVGDISWKPAIEQSNANSYTLMFVKANVFIRIYVKFKDENPYTAKEFTELLAKFYLSKLSI